MLRIRLLSRLGLLEPTVRLARWSVAQEATAAQPAAPAPKRAPKAPVLGYHADARSR